MYVYVLQKNKKQKKQVKSYKNKKEKTQCIKNSFRQNMSIAPQKTFCKNLGKKIQKKN